QAGEIEVALLESLDDAQRMEVMVEPVAEWTHELVETALARVAEGRVADVVNKRERLGEVGVQCQGPGNGAGNLRHLECMRQAVTEMVGVARREDLRLGFQAAEGACMDHPVAVARVVVAVGVSWLGVMATTGAAYVHCVARQPHRRATSFR